jgi:cation:H+ antiporter
MTSGILVIALLIILIGAEVFTNALEHLGERLKISDAMTSTIFTAVGTALPATMVPTVAILSTFGTLSVRQEMAVGAILGAPLMLATLVMFLIAVSAISRSGWEHHFSAEHPMLKRDLFWFLVAIGLCTAAIFVPHSMKWLRILIAMALILAYIVYLVRYFVSSGQYGAQGRRFQASERLYLFRLFGRLGVSENLAVIFMQFVIATAFIVFGTQGFVQGVERVSVWTGVSVLALSMMIVPLASELPEKFNSLLWVRKREDTLAFANITGAMVFQATLLPAVGIMLMPWEPRPEVLAGVILTFAASAYLLFRLRHGSLRAVHLFFNGFCYLACLIALLGWGYVPVAAQ